MYEFNLILSLKNATSLQYMIGKLEFIQYLRKNFLLYMLSNLSIAMLRIC